MSGFHKVAGWGPEAKRHPNDYYPTPPEVTRALLERETFPGPVLEPCAGAGHVVGELRRRGYGVLSNELFPQDAFAPDFAEDFLAGDPEMWGLCRSVVTNPPYRLAAEFIQRALDIGVERHAWLLRFQFIEGAGRHALFAEHPPRRMWVFSKRVQVSSLGLENPVGGMIVYAWWVWERGFTGHPELRWIDPGAVMSRKAS